MRLHRQPLDFLPFLSWVPSLTPQTLKADLYAGLTGAAIALPQGVAFAAIAGLPPEYGLFTAMIPAVIAALFGSSMVMISGPTTAISAVVMSALSGRYEIGSPEFIEAALLLAVLVGVIQLLFGFAKLGKLASFVSHSVMVGFTSAAACLIAISQIAGALGVPVATSGSILDRLMQVAPFLDQTDWRATVIAIATLFTTVVLARFVPKSPVFLIALALGTGVSFLISAPEHGVLTIGHLPSLIPSFHLPDTSIRDITQLAESALAIAMMGLLEAVAIGRVLAPRTGKRFKANDEVVGQGLSNFVGGFFPMLSRFRFVHPQRY